MCRESLQVANRFRTGVGRYVVTCVSV